MRQQWPQYWYQFLYLRTPDYKSQEVANRSYMIVRPVMQGRTINHAWSWTDKSRDWSGDWLNGRPCDWSCDLLRSVTTGCTTLFWSCNQSSFADGFILKGLGFKITLVIFVIQECLKSLLETTVSCQVLRTIPCDFLAILVRRVPSFILLILEFAMILHWIILFS